MALVVDDTLTKGNVFELCLTAEAYDFPTSSKSINTEDDSFSGGGALQQFPRGRRRLKWFAWA